MEPPGAVDRKFYFFLYIDEALKASQSFPKAPQSLPKALQRLLKPPQSSPKSPQSFPKPSSSFPKLSPKLPKASPKPPQISFGSPKAPRAKKREIDLSKMLTVLVFFENSKNRLPPLSAVHKGTFAK